MTAGTTKVKFHKGLQSYKAYELSKEIGREPGQTSVIVTATEKGAEAFKTDLEFFTAGRAKGEVCLFPAPDFIPYLHLNSQPDIWIDRLKILHKLAANKPLVVVMSIGAYLRKPPPKWIFKKYERQFNQHDIIVRDEFAAWLTEAGYINQPIVEDEGSFSMRGGIIDIFSPTTDRPVRLELDGDEIATIRTFDPLTQRSTFLVNSFTLIPVRNVILNEETKKHALGLLKNLCDENNIKPTERRGLAESIEHNFYSSAFETLMPIFYEGQTSFTDYISNNAKIHFSDEIEVKFEAEKLFEKLRKAHEEAKHIEKIVRPEELYDSYDRTNY